MSIRRRRQLLLGAAAFLLALFLAALTFPEPLLTLDSGPRTADAIVVLGGRAPERADRAAALFRSGAAPVIFVSGADDALDNRRVLISRGVPSDAIRLEPNSRSTMQNARFTIPLLRALPAKRVIIVTSWYHSRRALHTFRHYASDLQFYSRPAWSADSRSGWSFRPSGRFIRLEYLKLAGYCLCYGISPL